MSNPTDVDPGFGVPIKFIDRNSPEAKAEAARVAQFYIDNVAEKPEPQAWFDKLEWKPIKPPFQGELHDSLTMAAEFKKNQRADNPSGLMATEFKILVLADVVEEKTKGGIIKLASTREAEQFATTEGILIDAAPGAFTYLSDEEWGDKKPKVGDKVIYAKYSGRQAMGNDGKEYTFMADKDLLGIRR